MAGLRDARWDHWYVDDLPGDADETNTLRQVHGAAWTPVDPTPTAEPRLIAHSPDVAADLGLDPEYVTGDEFARIMSGNLVVPEMRPFAMNYGGHQFGNWAGQLGDGRAIALGELDTETGHHTLQLKGAGPTPYSRAGDGRAVLRSSIREFLCSEAVHHLGIPTTRALSLTLTGDDVMRDMLYDGRPELEPGAIVCRVAPSFVRFGHFELPATRGDLDLLRALVEHTVRRHFPHLLDGAPGASEQLPDSTIVRWFAEVADRTADLMVDWMRVGFVHGVMNTDNLSILGQTIDYGPYGWLEDFDPDWTPNTTDAGGRRYRYGHQPQLALWNLGRLGGAVHALTDDVDPLQDVLDGYAARYGSRWSETVTAKLGLRGLAEERTQALASELFDVMTLTETDMTILFRRLGDVDVTDPDVVDLDAADHVLVAPLRPALYRPDEMAGDTLARTAAWFRTYVDAARSAPLRGPERRTEMHRVNPKYVLRNYLAQLAIDKATVGEFSMIDELLDLLRTPYDDQPGRDEYASLRPEWARERVGCSMLSCSS